MPTTARASRAQQLPKTTRPSASISATGSIAPRSTSWGEGGFAMLPYQDYLIHATDVWVGQIGVLIKVDLWESGASEGANTSGLHRAAPAIPLADIRPYVINSGNNGHLSASGACWTTEADVERLFTETIPNATKDWSAQRVISTYGGQTPIDDHTQAT